MPERPGPRAEPGLGRVFNIQRYSLQDGPGLRTTVFLKGCPLQCAWCHNPESQDPGRALITMESRCMGCGACAEAGGSGVEACPTGARQWVGRDLALPALVEEVLRDRLFFDQSGGGVTFSGGEPLMQPAFLKGALSSFRALGVHTALDTCGAAPGKDLLEAAALADLVLYDLKHMDDAAHRAWTGSGNGTVLANLALLGRCHGNVRVRVPVIPSINDDGANLEATARFMAGLPGLRQVDLLPYHATGAVKFRRLGRTFLLDQLQTPTRARLESLARPFRARGLQVTIGGKP